MSPDASARDVVSCLGSRVRRSGFANAYSDDQAAVGPGPGAFGADDLGVEPVGLQRPGGHLVGAGFDQLAELSEQFLDGGPGQVHEEHGLLDADARSFQLFGDPVAAAVAADVVGHNPVHAMFPWVVVRRLWGEPSWQPFSAAAAPRGKSLLTARLRHISTSMRRPCDSPHGEERPCRLLRAFPGSSHIAVFFLRESSVTAGNSRLAGDRGEGFSLGAERKAVVATNAALTVTLGRYLALGAQVPDANK